MAIATLRTAKFYALVGYSVATYLSPQWSAFNLALSLLGWATWTLFLYPHVFSPLRGLPGPKNVSLQQAGELQILPSYAPAIEWYTASRDPSSALTRRPSC